MNNKVPGVKTQESTNAKAQRWALSEGILLHPTSKQSFKRVNDSSPFTDAIKPLVQGHTARKGQDQNSTQNCFALQLPDAAYYKNTLTMNILIQCFQWFGQLFLASRF